MPVRWTCTAALARPSHRIRAVRRITNMCRKSSRSWHEHGGSAGSRPGGEPAPRLRRGPTCRSRRRRASRPWHGMLTEMRATIGAVGEGLSRVVRQGIGAGASVIDIGRRDRNLLDQGARSIRADRGLETMHCRLAFVLKPSAITVLLARRSDDGGVHHRHDLEQSLVELVLDQLDGSKNRNCWLCQGPAVCSRLRYRVFRFLCWLGWPKPAVSSQ